MSLISYLNKGTGFRKCLINVPWLIDWIYSFFLCLISYLNRGTAYSKLFSNVRCTVLTFLFDIFFTTMYTTVPSNTSILWIKRAVKVCLFSLIHYPRRVQQAVYLWIVLDESAIHQHLSGKHLSAKHLSGKHLSYQINKQTGF